MAVSLFVQLDVSEEIVVPGILCALDLEAFHCGTSDARTDRF